MRISHIYLIVIALSVLVLRVQNAELSQCSDDDHWKCNNRECILSDDLCDGKVNCTDGSDEIAENCIQFKCPFLDYRCTYGACIAGDDKCNGVCDCADCSDELPQVCGKEVPSVRGRCGENQMECKSGDCIDEEAMCDGVADCRDGDDETVELCGGLKCDKVAFTCGYGACVPDVIVCDSRKDCRDGSDEAWSLCNRKRVFSQGNVTISNPSTTSTRSTSMSSTTITPSPPPRPPTNGCLIPSDRSNLIALMDWNNFTLSPGSFVPKFTIARFQCKQGYTLLGNERMTCLDEIPWRVPHCTKFCSGIDPGKTYSTKTICKYNGTIVSCEENVLPGTIVEESCQEQFQMIIPSDRRCTADYVWTGYRAVCRQSCGKPVPQTTNFVSHGKTESISQLPWHVGIYNGTAGNWRYICGGNIITATLVLTAAHCFFADSTATEPDPQYFMVTAGRNYSDLSHFEKYSQQQNILSIKIPNEYRQSRLTGDLLRADLAILIMDSPFIFTKAVRPVCLQFRTFPSKDVKSNERGEVASFGISHEQKPAEVLQSTVIRTLSYDDCRTALKNISETNDIFEDKFCITSTFSSVCKGDSGGGFVKQRADDRYELLGIISHALTSYLDCAREPHVTMTNIQYYENFIKPVIAAEEEKYNEPRTINDYYLFGSRQQIRDP